ncbi:NAD-dependent glycerol-3-phosphate dehydrogenase, partial [Piptocephalis cylindrospora]
MEKIALIGSGNWGSTMAKIVGKKALEENNNIDTAVNMWVFEETIEGRKLTDIINTEHENIKYLPGIPLPPNVRAIPNLLEAIEGATVLIFVVPHQFIEGLCAQMKGHTAPGARAISLIKGV